MTALLRFVVGHRTAANLLALGLVALGVWGGLGMRAQFFPDIVSERITIDIAWPGAGPAAVDAQIAARVDPVLLAVEGIERLDTTARDGRASFSMTFEPGADMARAAEEVRAAVDGLDDLPEDAEDPRTRRRSYLDRVTNIGLWGDVPPARLLRVAQELQGALFADGVTRVRIDGAPGPVLRVVARDADLVRHDVTLAEIADVLRRSAAAAPAGGMEAGAARVETGRDVRSVEALAALPLRSGADGARLRVRDVAEVRLEGLERGRAFLRDSAPLMILRVDRDADGDAIAIQRLVEARLEALRPDLPQGVRVATFGGRADAIAQRLDLLVDNAVTGLALVLGLLFLFLSARTAFWVAAGIPVAIFAALGLMHIAGLTLNMISMFALIICLGVVVDDAIVVGEHADHLARRGLKPEDAAREAAARMAAPVAAAAVTTVIAFLALTVIGGRFGAMILAIPLTVTMVLLASLAESFLILPAHMRHALAAKRRAPWYDAPSRAVDSAFAVVRDRAFRPVVAWALRWRYPVLAGVVGLLLHSLALPVSGELRWRFFDGPERATGALNVAMLPGATRADTAAMVAELERALVSVAARFEAEHGRPPLAFHHAVVGGDVGRGLPAADVKDADQLGGLWFELIDADARPYRTSAFLRAWREAVRPHPMLEAMAGRGERAGPGEDAVSIDLIGREAAALRAGARDLAAALEAVEGVVDVDSTVLEGRDRVVLTPTPLGRALGLDADALGAALRARLSGVEVASFPWEGRTATLVVGGDGDGLTADYLDRGLVRTSDGQWVRLADVAQRARSPDVASIRRRDGLPSATVSAELDRAAPDRAAAAQAAIETRILPTVAARHDLEVRLGGLREQERRFLSDAAFGLTLCLVGIYLTLALVFASWTTPLVVLLAAPLGLIGVLWGHHWMGVTLSMFSVVGMIGMTGIIVNDSIVLVTEAQRRAARAPTLTALADAAADRLRAVFLTTATTVAGLAPLLFEVSRQAQFLKPTVVTLAFGLGFGMALVLVATPAMVAVQADLARALNAARRLASALAAGRLRRRTAFQGRTEPAARLR